MRASDRGIDSAELKKRILECRLHIVRGKASGSEPIVLPVAGSRKERYKLLKVGTLEMPLNELLWLHFATGNSLAQMGKSWAVVQWVNYLQEGTDRSKVASK
jgi:hypothetical protein